MGSNHFAFDQTARSNMPIEHSPISNTDVWLTPNDVHKICQGLVTPQHQAKFSVGVDQIGQLAKPFGMHVGHLDRTTLTSA
jgi:hypothetical protein